MLHIPTDSAGEACVIGIDPGTDTLGVGVVFFDLQTMEITGSDAFTLNGAKNGRGSFTTQIHGDRFGRIESHRENLQRIFTHYNPLAIASESPFMSRRMPGAFQALLEVVAAIRQAVMAYDCWKSLAMIDPPTVKRIVGVSGKTGGPEGKKLMQQALLAMRETVQYRGSVEMERLDEHSIDALAVAYCHFIHLMEELCLRTLRSPVAESSLLSLPGSATRIIRARKKSRRFKKK